MSESLLAITDRGQLVRDFRRFPRALHEEGVVRIILDEEDGVGIEYRLHWLVVFACRVR